MQKKDKLFSIENSREFAATVMANNDFKSTHELAIFLKQLPYCVAPWIHTHLNPAGERKLCYVASPSGIDHTMPFSDFWNSEYLQNVRGKMLVNEPPSECLKCVNHQGPGSQKALYFHMLLKLEKLVSIKWGKYCEELPVSIDYRINKVCSYACRMCSSTASSTIEKLEIDSSAITSDYKISGESFLKLKDELFIILKTGKMIDINFADGEPLTSKLHWEMLEYLVSSGMSKNIILRYTSNLSTLYYNNIFIPNYLNENFSKVIISISFDGVEKTAEFIRDGLSWNQWYINYNLLKESLGAQSINFNITITIPGLLDIENIARFLDREQLAFSIGSSYSQGNELLLSPLALDSYSRTNIIISRLKNIDNTQVRDYLETLLIINDDSAFEDLRNNFNSIRIYYTKIDSEKKRLSTIEYLSKEVELNKWWNLICPPELQRKYSPIKQRHNWFVQIIPNELGRLFYNLTYCLIKFYFFVKYKGAVKIWPRNSIYLSYFKWGQSDLDLSVELIQDNILFENGLKIKKMLLKCPLVKEINFYYPYSLKKNSLFVNLFELQRDKCLSKKTTADFKGPAQSFTFLLRMLMANEQIYLEGLKGRNVFKWRYYLNHSQTSFDNNEIYEGIKLTELLKLILRIYSLDEVVYLKSIERVMFYNLEKIPSNHELKHKNEMASLFPQVFCHLDLSLSNLDIFNEEVFIAQMSWEFSSLMNQVKSVFELGSTENHIENLKRMLKQARLKDEKMIEMKDHLLLHLNSFEQFIKGKNE